jgi:glycerophosphoryl diester phosphodiesterase
MRGWLAVIGFVALAIAACGGDDDAAPGTTADMSTAVPATPAPGTTAPGTTAPGTTAPGTTAPGTTAPGTAAPGTTAPVPSTGAPAPARPPTIDELLASGRVLNIAHAGGDQDHPHSTMYAYRQSVAAGADVLELDVQLTADGVLIVQHDPDTQKTTDQNLVVADTDLATLQALDNAYWWSPQCWPCHDLADDAYPFRGVRTGAVPPPAGFTPDDFRIVTLAEMAAAFPALPLDIEIKGDPEVGPAVAAALAAELTALDRLDSTVVASFDSAVIQQFHALAPDVAVSPGVNEMAAWLLGGGELAEHYRIVQVPPFYDTGGDVIEVLSEANLATAEAAGVAVWVWPNDAATQENEEFYAELVAMGVDGIIAGRPAAATAAIP